MQYTTPDVEFSKIKKRLKGKRISVTESLTKKCMEAPKKAREDHRFENTWSSEGKSYKNVSKGSEIKVYFH